VRRRAESTEFALSDTDGRWTTGNAGRNDCQSSRRVGCVEAPRRVSPTLRRQRRRPRHQQVRRPPSRSPHRRPRRPYPLAKRSEQ